MPCLGREEEDAKEKEMKSFKQIGSLNLGGGYLHGDAMLANRLQSIVLHLERSITLFKVERRTKGK
jgi:hypothetical protein